MLKWLKKVHLEERISKIYILVLRVNGIENHGKKIEELKNIDQNYYCSNYYDVICNKNFLAIVIWINKDEIFKTKIILLW